MLQVEDLWVRWPDFELCGISLEVGREYFVLLGPSGAGKTLLLQTIAGFWQPERGRIVLNGRDITHLAPEDRRIGYVPQEYKLFPHLSVRENIAFGMKSRSSQRVRELAALVGAEHLLDRRPETLSGGEQQRVALARALASDPALLLLDEPLGAVDPPYRRQLQQLLKRVHQETGIPVIHVTHDHLEAFTLADRIAVMEDGRIVETGTPERLLYQPRSAFVARFLLIENLLRGEVRQHQNGVTLVDVGGTSIAVAGMHHGTLLLAIRPEDILISRTLPHTSGRNVLFCTIEKIDTTTPLIRLTLNAGSFHLHAVITRAALEELELKQGDTIYAIFKATAVNPIPVK